jgi:hypothetical protein
LELSVLFFLFVYNMLKWFSFLFWMLIFDWYLICGMCGDNNDDIVVVDC